MPTTFPKNSFKRKRGVPAHPRRGNVRDVRVTSSSPQLSVYHGTDRAGSFRRVGDDLFEAHDRLGRSLGVHKTQDAALAAIAREATS
jgi:hypothetical protein